MKRALALLLCSLAATPAIAQREPAAPPPGSHDVRALGAIGNGVADDQHALTTARMPALLPPGTYFTGTSIRAMPAGHWYSPGGAGRLSFRDGSTVRLGPPNLSIIARPPAEAPGYSDDGINTAFDGDFRHTHLAALTIIRGAATLGQPVRGYRLDPLASQIYLNLANASGWNQSPDGNGGRTGVAQLYLRFSNSGPGDTGGVFCNGFVAGVKPGATSFLANGAGGCIGGQIMAGADGVYLQGLGDINLADQGHDVSGIGLVLNSQRTNGGGANGATWMAIRPQSSGTVPIDAFYSAGGKARIGLDLTGATLLDLAGQPVKTAITLKAGQAIYGNATNTNPTRFARYTEAGREWLGYEAASGWNLVVAGLPVLQAGAAGVSATRLRVTDPAVPKTAHDACRKGEIAYDDAHVYICVGPDHWKRAALADW